MIITICPNCMNTNTFKDNEIQGASCRCCKFNLDEYYCEGKTPAEYNEWIKQERDRLKNIKNEIDEEIKKIRLFDSEIIVDIDPSIYRIPDSISNRIKEQEKVIFLRNSGNITYRDAELLILAIERHNTKSLFGNVTGFSVPEINYTLKTIFMEVSRHDGGDESNASNKSKKSGNLFFAVFKFLAILVLAILLINHFIDRFSIHFLN